MKLKIEMERRINKNIKVLSSNVAEQILTDHAEIKKRTGCGNKIIVLLITGGYWSQSIDTLVMRKLGIQAGWIKQL